VAAAAASLVLGAALLAVVASGRGSATRWAVLTGGSPGMTESNDIVQITTEDVNSANRQVAADLHALQTEKAGHIAGSRPTDEIEAESIIGSMDHYVRTMGEPYAAYTRPHSDAAKEADAIIGACE